MRKLLLQLLFISTLYNSANAQIQLDSTQLDTSIVAKNLDVPWEILWGPDNYLWITERGGTISKINPTSGEKTVLTTIQSVQEHSESGLLGMVLHPQFTDNPYVYVVYTHNENGFKERLVRFEYTGSTLVNEEILIDNITANSNHDGSRLIIDGTGRILMTTGDAQNTQLSQDPSSLNGKVLRINLNGSIPNDNPNPNSYVYTTGHRNAQGLTMGNGIVYSSEHGPNNDDELNIIYANRNYGWPFVHGFCDGPSEQTFCSDSQVVEPIKAWTPTLAVAGLDYYNHPSIPEWQNSLLLTTLKEDDLRVLKLNNDGDQITSEDIYLNNWFGRIRDICVAPNGDIYLSTSNRDGRANNGFPRAIDDRIIRLSNPNTNSIQPKNKVNFKIQPNPTDQGFQIVLPPNQQTESIQIYNSLGQQIGENWQAKKEIATLNWPKGFYWVQLEFVSGARVTQKLCVR